MVTTSYTHCCISQIVHNGGAETPNASHEAQINSWGRSLGDDFF